MPLITGKNGFIAGRLIEKFNTNNLKAQVTSHECNDNKNCFSLDLRSPEKFEYDRITSQHYVVHLAAVSSPDVCLNKYDYALQVNVKGTCHFIENCLKQGARVLFFSSDTVYGPSHQIFDEDAECTPVGIYGEMKNTVEKHFAGENLFKVFRLSYVFSKKDKYTQYLAKCCEQNSPVEVYHPLYRNVVYLEDVLEAVFDLYGKWDSFDNSIFNICGQELLSRKDLAYIFKELICPTLDIAIVRPDESFYKARPATIHLRSKYLSSLLSRKPTLISKAMGLEFK